MTQCYKSLLLTAALVGCLSRTSLAFQAVSPMAATTSSSARPLSTKLFMAQKMTPTRKTRREDSFDRDDSEEDGSKESAEDIIFDYSEAQSKMKEDENKRRVEEGLTVGLTKEVRCSLIIIADLLLSCAPSLIIYLILLISGRRGIRGEEGSIRGHEGQNQITGIAGGIRKVSSHQKGHRGGNSKGHGRIFLCHG